MYFDAPNTQLLAGVRCPMCFNTGKFIIQTTMNVIVEDDGLDFMASPPEDDLFPEQPVAAENGLFDDDPIHCAGRNGCGHTGTVGEFKALSRQAAADDAARDATKNTVVVGGITFTRRSDAERDSAERDSAISQIHEATGGY